MATITSEKTASGPSQPPDLEDTDAPPPYEAGPASENFEDAKDEKKRLAELSATYAASSVENAHNTSLEGSRERTTYASSSAANARHPSQERPETAEHRHKSFFSSLFSKK
jgi:hypothetical protein